MYQSPFSNYLFCRGLSSQFRRTATAVSSGNPPLLLLPHGGLGSSAEDVATWPTRLATTAAPNQELATDNRYLTRSRIHLMRTF